MKKFIQAFIMVLAVLLSTASRSSAQGCDLVECPPPPPVQCFIENGMCTAHYDYSTGPETRTALDPRDPIGQSLSLTLASVINPIGIDVDVTFFYEPTELSEGHSGIGIADGICEAGAGVDRNNPTTFDFDCLLTPVFKYRNIPNGQLVPHIIPSEKLKRGVWVRVETKAKAGIDYTGPVDWYYAWLRILDLVNAPPPQGGYLPTTVTQTPLNSQYPAGWNKDNPQMYDRPGELPPGFPNPSFRYIRNITTISKSCDPDCVGHPDPGLGGRTITLNDVVVAAPPNPPVGTDADEGELHVPFPNTTLTTPFHYFKGLPMLVTFQLEKERTETSDPFGVTLPHSVNVATLENGVDSTTGLPMQTNVPVQYPAGFPTAVTYNSFFKSYYVFLSPAPYKTDGTVYTLQINSDLLPKPIIAYFVVTDHKEN